MVNGERRRRIRETSVFLETAKTRYVQDEKDLTVDAKLAVMARNLVAVYEINRESVTALVTAVRKQHLDCESFRWLLCLLGPALLKAKHKQDEVDHVLRVLAMSWSQPQPAA